MTEHGDPAVDRDAAPRTGNKRAVPPLVWIILVILAAVAIFAASQWRGSHRSASGEVMPQTEPYTAAPAT